MHFSLRLQIQILVSGSKSGSSSTTGIGFGFGFGLCFCFLFLSRLGFGFSFLCCSTSCISHDLFVFCLSQAFYGALFVALVALSHLFVINVSMCVGHASVLYVCVCETSVCVCRSVKSKLN